MSEQQRGARKLAQVWVATGQVLDLVSDPEFEIVGVFSSEDEALEAARRVFPHTGGATPYPLDKALIGPER